MPPLFLLKRRIIMNELIHLTDNGPLYFICPNCGDIIKENNLSIHILSDNDLNILEEYIKCSCKKCSGIKSYILNTTYSEYIAKALSNITKNNLSIIRFEKIKPDEKYNYYIISIKLDDLVNKKTDTISYKTINKKYETISNIIKEINTNLLTSILSLNACNINDDKYIMNIFIKEPIIK